MSNKDTFCGNWPLPSHCIETLKSRADYLVECGEDLNEQVELHAISIILMLYDSATAVTEPL
jgi:hypothetical protein|nr:MAG TPA: hypothetical protein [Caudoviricetes sp.]